MLYVVNIENAHEFGDVLPKLFRLRYKQFIERQGYDVPVYKNMEYDQYDTPATVYLVWLDKNRVVRGSSRLNPSDRPYMLRDLWPEMSELPLPNSPYSWEGTRICIEKGLPSPLRDQIKWEMVIGYLEFGLENNIKKIFGVMQNFIWRRVFIQAGWEIEYMGQERLIDGQKIRAGQGEVSQRMLDKVRQETGIFYPVLANHYKTELQESLDETKPNSTAPVIEVA